MNSLIANYLKRAFIVPVVLTALVIFALSVIVPKYISSSQTTQTSYVEQLRYEKVDYETFNQLKANETIGYMSSNDFDFSSNVIFNSNIAKHSSLSKDSTEPWNGGCVVVFGTNTKTQFNSLHKAEKGYKIDFEFYGKDKYTYKITDIISNQTKEDISKLKKDNTLLLCLSYNDFSDLGNSYFYTVYVAEMV